MVGGVKMYEDCRERHSCNRYPNGCAAICYLPNTNPYSDFLNNGCQQSGVGCGICGENLKYDPQLRLIEGPRGFSPSITIKYNTPELYVLTITQIDSDGHVTSWDTPNLIGSGVPAPEQPEGGGGSTPTPDQPGGGNITSLPIATESTLGGIIVGKGLTIDEQGVLNSQTAIFDSIPTEGSFNPVTSGGIKEYVDSAFIYDNTLLDDSEHLVKGGDIKKYVDEADAKIAPGIEFYLNAQKTGDDFGVFTKELKMPYGWVKPYWQFTDFT